MNRRRGRAQSNVHSQRIVAAEVAVGPAEIGAATPAQVPSPPTVEAEAAAPAPTAEAVVVAPLRPAHVVVPAPEAEAVYRPSGPSTPEGGSIRPLYDSLAPVVPASERETLTELVALEMEHESFFAAGAATLDGSGDEDLAIELPTDPKLELKRRPEVQARRARLTRYVQWTVGALSAVCMVAVVKVAAGGLRHAHQGAASLGAAVATPLVASIAPVTPAQTQAQDPGKQDPLAAQPAAPAVAAAADAPPAPPVPEVAPAPEPSATPDERAPEKTAAEEKRDAQRALERAAFTKAAEAAARSVALDPTDGEAWLLLGAAYQSLGKNADARSAFLSCTKQGTRGPVGECRAMLR